jgi:hypothetical protein
MGEIRDFDPGKRGEPPNGIAPRRLAAIIAGDIAGYSRLMQQDEEGTHARVMRIQRDLVEPSILEHRGRLVKTTPSVREPEMVALRGGSFAMGRSRRGHQSRAAAC